MRKLLPVILLLILAGVLIGVSISDRDERSLPTRFEEGMNFAEYRIYVDPDFSYSFYYPSFFRREEDPGLGPGHVRFGFHSETANMVIECRVLPGRVRPHGKSDQVEEGTVAGVAGYHFLSHFVWRHGRWYVLSLSYPDEYRQAVSRLVYMVKRWYPEPAKSIRLQQSPSHHPRQQSGE